SMSATRAPRRAASQAAAAPITPAPIMAKSHSRITSQEFNTATPGRYAVAENDQAALAKLREAADRQAIMWRARAKAFQMRPRNSFLSLGNALAEDQTKPCARQPPLTVWLPCARRGEFLSASWFAVGFA